MAVVRQTVETNRSIMSQSPSIFSIKEHARAKFDLGAYLTNNADRIDISMYRPVVKAVLYLFSI